MARIAIIHTTYSRPALGGATVDLDGLLPRLSREHEVVLLLPGFPGPMSRCHLEDPPPVPYEVIRFQPWNWRPGPLGRRFREAVQRWEPDLVLVMDGWHLKPYLMNALEPYRRILRFYTHETLCLRGNGLLFRRGAACDTSFLTTPGTCRRCALRYPVRGYWYKHELLASRFWSRGYHDQVRRHLAGAETVIVSNQGIADLVSPHSRRVRIIPAGLEPEELDPEVPVPTGEPMTILAPGRVGDPAKGIGVLIRAVEILRKRGLPVELWTTGATDAPGARDLGWMPREELRRAYRKTQVVVVPSIWSEPLGLVALEGMAAGRPVVASEIGGLPSLIRDGTTGFLFPPGQPEPLADRLAELAASPELRERLGRAGRKLVRDRFLWDQVYRRHYRPLLAETLG